MSRNAQEYQAYLLANDLDFVETKDGGTVVQTKETLESGGSLKTLTYFKSDDTIVEIHGIDYIDGISPAKMDYMYEVVNDLNNKYTYFKFVLDKNLLSIQVFIPVENNFSSEIIMNMVLVMVDVYD